VVEQPEFLEHDPDPPPERWQLVPRGGRDIPPEHGDRPPGGPFRQVDEFQERRFTRAGWSGEQVERPLVERERNVTQDFRPQSVPHPDILEADHRLFLLG
jgi:hypothetical protein